MNGISYFSENTNTQKRSLMATALFEKCKEVEEGTLKMVLLIKEYWYAEAVTLGNALIKESKKLKRMGRR